MSKNEKIWLAAGAIAITGAMVLAYRRLNARKILREVSDEGYETAHDVLYPRAHRATGRTHYGPVIPE